jgi:hypothetical protein
LDKVIFNNDEITKSLSNLQNAIVGTDEWRKALNKAGDVISKNINENLSIAESQTKKVTEAFSAFSNSQINYAKELAAGDARQKEQGIRILEDLKWQNEWKRLYATSAAEAIQIDKEQLQILDAMKLAGVDQSKIYQERLSISEDISNKYKEMAEDEKKQSELIQDNVSESDELVTKIGEIKNTVEALSASWETNFNGNVKNGQAELSLITGEIIKIKELIESIPPIPIRVNSGNNEIDKYLEDALRGPQ